MVPVVFGLLAGAYALKWLASDDQPAPAVEAREPRYSEPRSILDQNLIELSSQLAAVRARRVVVLGQPGAGKSALVDTLTDESLEPRPVIGVMTDQTDWAHRHRVELPVARDGSVWIDSPGYGTQRHPVASFQEYFGFGHVDRLVLAFSGKLRDSDDSLLSLLRLRRLKQVLGAEIFLVRTQAETLDAQARKIVTAELNARAPVGAKVMIVSVRTGEGIDELSRAIR